MKTEEKEGLEGFEGFDAGSATFFAETSPVTTTDEIVDEIVNDDLLEEQKGSEVKPVKETTEDISFFEGNEEEEEEEEDSLAPASKDSVVKVDNKTTLEFLKTKGLVDFELEEGTELTNELAEEILEDTWEDSIMEAADEKIKSLPQGLKQMIKIALAGGDFSAMFTQLANQAKVGITADTDMEVEANQISVMQQNLASQGYDQDYIDTHIEVLKDSGKLKAIAEKVKTKIVADQEVANQQEVERASKQKKNSVESQRKYKLETTEYINTVENIKGIVLNKKDKEELPSYMSDIVVTMPDGRKVTKYQKELFEIFADKESSVLLAKLIKDKFDFSSLEKKAITAQARTIRNKIQHAKDVTVTGSKGSSRKPSKSLADMLD